MVSQFTYRLKTCMNHERNSQCDYAIENAPSGGLIVECNTCNTRWNATHATHCGMQHMQHTVECNTLPTAFRCELQQGECTEHRQNTNGDGLCVGGGREGGGAEREFIDRGRGSGGGCAGRLEGRRMAADAKDRRGLVGGPRHSPLVCLGAALIASRLLARRARRLHVTPMYMYVYTYILCMYIYVNK